MVLRVLQDLDPRIVPNGTRLAPVGGGIVDQQHFQRSAPWLAGKERGETVIQRPPVPLHDNDVQGVRVRSRHVGSRLTPVSSTAPAIQQSPACSAPPGWPLLAHARPKRVVCERSCRRQAEDMTDAVRLSMLAGTLAKRRATRFGPTGWLLREIW